MTVLAIAGSEMSGGVRNVFIDNVTTPVSGSVICFKSNLDRGSAIRDVVAQNLKSGTSSIFLEVVQGCARGCACA